METMEKSAIETEETPKKTEGGDYGKPLTVCFVCTGNTCRSPMAAAILNDMARIPQVCSMSDIEKLLNSRRIRAVSAGLYADGSPISENAVRALENAGIRSLPDNDYKSHISTSVTPELMETCDRVIGISGGHAMRLISFFPQYASKITCLPHDIPDPFGGDLAAYETCLAAIRADVVQMFFPEREG